MGPPQRADLPAAAAAARVVVRAWGAEVLALYGWAPSGEELACGGCAAVGALCEVFAAGRPYHPPASPAASACRLQAGRRRLYGREWARRGRAVSEATALPADLVRLVLDCVPSFGLVLRWGHLLGSHPDAVGPHSECDLCQLRPMWAPGVQASARLAAQIASCEARSCEALEAGRLTWYQDASQYAASRPRPCRRCGRLLVPSVQKVPCAEHSGRGVGLRCRCAEALWLSCFHCSEHVRLAAPVAGALALR
ncbi:MAG TPA: hypothetical protein VNI01_12655 [Elusimicrobiota bacterium]|nr:hypothetical protein [Elusimicrobiota bacterium]